MARVLVVSNDAAGLAATLGILGHAGYSAIGAATFEEAKHLLAKGSPDLVIADQRLGPFNGLHVILRARAEHPGLNAIVTTCAVDRGFEADARSLHVDCVVKPRNPRGWLAPVAKALATSRAVPVPSAGVSQSTRARPGAPRRG